MLARDMRLRTAAEFTAVVRAGKRAGTRRLVIHLLIQDQHVEGELDREKLVPPRAGFVVSAKVGNSVVRHSVTRRLRPLVREHLGTLPSGTALVVRALPSAKHASSAELAGDLRSGLSSALRKATSKTGAGVTQSIGGPSDA